VSTVNRCVVVRCINGKTLRKDQRRRSILTIVHDLSKQQIYEHGIEHDLKVHYHDANTLSRYAIVFLDLAAEFIALSDRVLKLRD